MLLISLALATIPMALAATSLESAIVVTAARTPVALDLSGTAISVVDNSTITALDLPLAADYLRLVPSVAVASTGPLGAQTQVRIRGAEANQTLTFIDGIKVNDPASSGEFRWETLLADGVDRIEVLRGPQSALWGSEAIGGVVNITTRSPVAGTAAFGQAEAGSFGTVNLGGGVNVGTEKGGIVAQGAWLHSTGIDTSNSGGDKDGYNNVTLSAKGVWHATADLDIGGVARFVSATTNFDDFDYVLGKSIDAPLSSQAQAVALRGYATLNSYDDRWINHVEATYNDTANRNFNAGVFLNRSDGSDTKLAYQSTGIFTTGSIEHKLTGAVEFDHQTFVSTDADPAALSNQSRSRNQTSLIGEYRLTANDILSVIGSVRRDLNSAYADTTTFRVATALALPQGFRAHASFGEGVADPTFFDLYGYFPAYFVGNPNLVPETSQGWDAGLGWRHGIVTADLTWFHTNLTNEIVSTYDFTTRLASVANATGTSQRQGLEASVALTPAPWLTLAATYAYLNATEQQVAAGLATRELRRPKNSGSLTATVTQDAWQGSVSAAYVGARYDTNFATFETVTLPAYTLLTLAGSYRLNRNVAFTARIENAADAHYQDVYGYRTMGIGGFAGVRLNWGG